MSKKANWFENVEDREHPWSGLGLKWLTTGLCVPDVQQAVDFYTDAMGMVAIAELEDDDDLMLFTRLRYRGVNITLNKEHWDSELLSPLTSGQAPSFIFYLYVDDLAQVVNNMTAADATVLTPPTEMFWGDLKARVKDPFGYIWDVAQKI